MRCFIALFKKDFKNSFTNKNVLVLYDLLGKIQDECGFKKKMLDDVIVKRLL